jgi:hypothetical protein
VDAEAGVRLGGGCGGCDGVIEVLECAKQSKSQRQSSSYMNLSSFTGTQWNTLRELSNVGFG